MPCVQLLLEQEDAGDDVEEAGGASHRGAAARPPCAPVTRHVHPIFTGEVIARLKGFRPRSGTGILVLGSWAAADGLDSQGVLRAC